MQIRDSAVRDDDEHVVFGFLLCALAWDTGMLGLSLGRSASESYLP